MFFMPAPRDVSNRHLLEDVDAIIGSKVVGKEKRRKPPTMTSVLSMESPPFRPRGGGGGVGGSGSGSGNNATIPASSSAAASTSAGASPGWMPFARSPMTTTTTGAALGGVPRPKYGRSSLSAGGGGEGRHRVGSRMKYPPHRSLSPPFVPSISKK